MKEKTEQAAVAMHAELSTQHLTSKRRRLTAQQVMNLVCKRYGYDRSSIYRFIKKHGKKGNLS